MPVRLPSPLLLALALGASAAPGCRLVEDGGPSFEAAPFDLDHAVESARMSLYSYEMLTAYLEDEEVTLPEEYTLLGTAVTYQWFSAEPQFGDDPTPIFLAAARGEELHLIFRGTITPSEWLDDLTFGQVPFDVVDDAGLVHQGTADVYMSVRHAVMDLSRDHLEENPEAPVFLTGHSLGGGLAVLAALDVAAEFDVSPVLYTFAGPRVGDEEFQVAYRERVHTSWRVTNVNDIVPRFPPTSVAVTASDEQKIRRYFHVNAERPVEFGNPVQLPRSNFWEAGLDGDLSTPFDIKAAEVDFSVPTVVTNHRVCNYFNALCDEAEDPEACRARTDGADGCNAD